MRLELQAILVVVMVRRLLLVRGQDGALIPSMVCRLHLGHALLIVDQDTVDASFAASLILRKTAHLVLDLPLPSTGVLGNCI